MWSRKSCLLLLNSKVGLFFVIAVPEDLHAIHQGPVLRNKIKLTQDKR